MNTNTVTTVDLATRELHKAFNQLNEKFFNNELPEVIIAVIPTAAKKAYGWFTFGRIWKEGDGEEAKTYHEIAMSAEYMNRPLDKVIGTLIHEMVHHYCNHKGIKDTRRKGKYHNDRFKTEAEKAGLIVPMDAPHPSLGWYQTEVTEGTAKWIENGLDINPENLKIHRVIVEKARKKKNVHKYICPSCDLKLRVNKPMNLKCNDCDEDLVEF